MVVRTYIGPADGGFYSTEGIAYKVFHTALFEVMRSNLGQELPPYEQSNISPHSVEHPF